MSVHSGQTQRVSTRTLRQMKADGEKISMLTAYDYTLASLIDSAGIDIILVGDSASNVVCGNSTTLPITLDEMIFLTRGVRKAAQRAFVLFDMPFGSYQESEERAMQNAVRVMKETGADGLKIEGGRQIVPLVRKLTASGIPVMAHLGLTPQSVNQFGGYALRAKEEKEAQQLFEDSLALEEAGCFSLLYEKIPAALGAKVTHAVKVPTIGIGAGGEMDGQVLVLHDMLGITQGFQPKFLRRFANIGETIKEATREYIAAVKDCSFPNQEEQY